MAESLSEDCLVEQLLQRMLTRIEYFFILVAVSYSQELFTHIGPTCMRLESLKIRGKFTMDAILQTDHDVPLFPELKVLAVSVLDIGDSVVK
jgi:hypothetical protein